MLILLSPAKNLNFDPAPGAPAPTKPALLKDASELAAVAKKLSKAQIKRLMSISDKLAELNHERFQALRADGKSNGAKQAALAFNGDVYLGLDAGVTVITVLITLVAGLMIGNLLIAPRRNL